MSFLVVDKVMLTCSYGTCSSKLKVTALKLPAMSFDVTLPSMELGLGLGLGFGAGFGVGAGFGLSANLSLPHGLVKKFNATGQLVAQANFQAGIMIGESLAFDLAGHVSQRLMFVAGKVHGMASLYANGALTGAINFKHGHMHGMSKFYDMHGRLVVQTNFAGGLEDGMRITFNVETGAILQQELYIKGLLNGVAQVAGGLGAGFEFEVALPEVSLDIDMDLDLDIGVLATINGSVVATIMDHMSNVNIRPFCYCTSHANPAVAAATKRAHGKLTPQPCTPKTNSPWVPGSHDATMQGHATLTHTSRLYCAYAGVIHVNDPGQKKASVR